MEKRSIVCALGAKNNCFLGLEPSVSLLNVRTVSLEARSRATEMISCSYKNVTSNFVIRDAGTRA